MLLKRMFSISEKALLERNRPKNYKRETFGWEKLTHFSIYGGLGLLTLFLATGPDTNIRSWALEEAVARRNMKAEPVYGHVYSGKYGELNK